LLGAREGMTMQAREGITIVPSQCSYLRGLMVSIKPGT
jgi:hypothetical protein